MRSDFAEKQHENAANIELARDGGKVFAPGQVEESILGYDAAARPGHPAANVLLEVAGIVLPPAVWLTPTGGCDARARHRRASCQIVLRVFCSSSSAPNS